MKVKLNDIIEALDFANPETQYYYSIKTEEILMVWDGMVWYAKWRDCPRIN